MANIQHGINQLIAMTALGTGLYTRSAGGQAKAATGEADTFAQAAEGYKKTLADPTAFTGTPEQQALKRQGMQELYRSNRDSAVKSRLRALNLKPTRERVESYLNSYAEQQEEIRLENAQKAESRAAQAKKKAMDRMRELGAQQIQQTKTRRNFMDYLAQQSSSLGGKIGDLPESVQKKIAKEYSSAERKKLMDEEDAKKQEVKNGRKI